jgi:hypothetical protein
VLVSRPPALNVPMGPTPTSLDKQNAPSAPLVMPARTRELTLWCVLQGAMPQLAPWSAQAVMPVISALPLVELWEFVLTAHTLSPTGLTVWSVLLGIAV